MNIKFIEAKQAKELYQFKNIKIKLYRTNATICYNKICWQKRLTPKYTNIRINGKSQQCQKTVKEDAHFRINQEIMGSNFSTIAESSRHGLTVPDAVITVICAPDDEWSNHLKHVEQFTEIQSVQPKSGRYFSMCNLFTKIYMLYYTTNLYLQ
jgi:hypothetical protein